MNSKKPHLWKGQYCSFVDIAKLESISYDVLKKAFYKSRDLEKAIDYAKNTFSFKDHIKYEYNGKMYNLSQVASVISKDTGHTIETIKGRIKAGWTIEDAIATPKYKLCAEKQESYREKLGAQVRIYDLDDNLLYEFNTYGETARFLGTTQNNVFNACMRLGTFQGKYRIRSKSSSPERKELAGLKAKAKNKKCCRVKYPTPELHELSLERCKKLKKTLYYNKNKDQIIQKSKDYYFRNFDVKLANNKKYYMYNKDYLKQKHKEWIAKNKDSHNQYHINYRRNASDTLSDVYIKTTLATTLGLKTGQITPEMIDIKRKQVKLYRSLK